MKDYVKRDAELDARASRSSEELAKHRWHWTLDKANPERDSIAEYARQVKRSEATIRKYAVGYQTIITQRNDLTLDEAMELANMGAERQAATEAVAKASKVSIRSVRAGQHRAEVNEVITTARARAERNESRVEDEIVTVAKQRAQSKKAGKAHAEERKSRSSLRFVEVEGDLAGAKKKLADALRHAEDVEFTDDEMTLLRDTIANVRTLLNLIDMRLAGTPDIDWDKELATLTKETQ